MNPLRINTFFNDEKGPTEQNLSNKPIYTKVLVTSRKNLKPERTIKLSEEHKKIINNNDLNSMDHNHSTNFESNTPDQLKKIKRIKKIERDFRNYLTNQTNKSSKKKIYANNTKILKDKERIKTMINKEKTNNSNNSLLVTKRKYLIKSDFSWNKSVDSDKKNNTIENMKLKYSKNKAVSDFKIGINIINNNKCNSKNISGCKKLNKEKFENLFLRVENLLNNYQDIINYYQEKEKLNKNK